MGVHWEWRAEGDPSMGGTRYPYFICDGCGEKIHGMGKIVFELEEDDPTKATGRWWVFGKGSAHAACETPESSRRPWDDLDEFLVQIAFNSGFDLADTEAKMKGRREKFGI